MSSSAQSLVVPSLKNILFATDFSPCSEAAYPYLRDIAEHYGSTIHVVHVIAPEPMLEVPLDLIPELETDRDAAESSFAEMRAKVPFGGIPCTWTARRGPFWPVLSALIEEQKIELIVLGTHGRRGLRKLVLGSAAEKVFRQARCPVLTVGPQAAVHDTAPLRHANILFATDFSAGSEEALPYAASLARAYKSHLIVVHAVSAGAEIVPSDFNCGAATVELTAEFIADAMASARRRMEDFVAARIMHELQPEMIVKCGASAATILDVAAAKHADLIVMGAHRSSQSSLITHVPWATASAVVCEAHCPVLTVRS